MEMWHSFEQGYEGAKIGSCFCLTFITASSSDSTSILTWGTSPSLLTFMGLSGFPPSRGRHMTQAQPEHIALTSVGDM